MNPLQDYLDSIANYEGLHVPDDFYDSVGGIWSGAEAQINELTAQITELQAQLQAVQAHNYQLITAAQAPADADVSGDPTEGDNDGDGEDDAPDIDDFFEDEDEEIK